MTTESQTGTDENGSAEGSGKGSDSTDTTNQPTADLSAIASHFATNMPEVQEHAISKATADATAAANAPTDKNGTRFDPSIHASGPDGKGMLTARGTWALKRGRAARGNVADSVKGSTLTTPTPADPKKAADEAASRNAGVAAATMFVVACRTLGGDEWAPVKDDKTGQDEMAMLQGAYADYFAATGKKDVPPGVALSFAMLAYMAPRFFMPVTRSRLATLKSKVVQWWVNRKLRKQGLHAEVSSAEGARNKGE